MSPSGRASGPLAGIRVVDLTAVISGPLATQILGDQGADVIKVEPPGIGDLTRPMGTQRSGLSAIYAAANRNKRSVILDLAQAAGLDVFARLVETADVLVQNFRPGAAERMGIGYDYMKARNDGLIYVSISGFGADGPFSGRRVYDPLIQAASGMAWAQGQAPGSDGEPRLVRSIVCDKVTGLYASQAITAALFARERGAGGQHVKLSMLDSAIAFHWSDMMWNHSFLESDDPHCQPIVRTADLADMFRLYDCADGTVIVVAGGETEFRALCRAFNQESRADDPKFATMLDRMQNIEELISWQEQEIRGRTTDELCALLDQAGVPCSRVNSIPELVNDPQVKHNRSIETVDHPVGGPMLQAKPPIDFSRTPARVDRLAPQHGEHSVEVLREIGIGEAQLASLLESGVLGVD